MHECCADEGAHTLNGLPRLPGRTFCPKSLKVSLLNALRGAFSSAESGASAQRSHLLLLPVAYHLMVLIAFAHALH